MMVGGTNESILIFQTSKSVKDYGKIIAPNLAYWQLERQKNDYY